MISTAVLTGIVTYNPDIDRLKHNLKNICKQTKQVIIVDNFSDNFDDIIQVALQYDNVSLIKNEKNMGIARALNQIGNYASLKQYKAFLMLDQDSLASDDLVKILYEKLERENVGMTCPYINRKNDYKPNNIINEVYSAITSGSMVKTDVWSDIGGFWEYLFIDEVDHEFCYQVRKKGLKILQVNETAIDHIVGEPFSKKVLGHTFHPTNHSAFRRYYIIRNNIIMKHLYPKEKYPFPHRYRMIFRIIISVLLCEEKKQEKISAIFKGIRDAIKWNISNSTIKCRRNLDD